MFDGAMMDRQEAMLTRGTATIPKFAMGAIYHPERRYRGQAARRAMMAPRKRMQGVQGTESQGSIFAAFWRNEMNFASRPHGCQRKRSIHEYYAGQNQNEK